MPGRHLRFRFTRDGRMAEGPADMSVTYVGRVDRRFAEADARRRFEEWRHLPDISRMRACDQVVVS